MPHLAAAATVQNAARFPLQGGEHAVPHSAAVRKAVHFPLQGGAPLVDQGRTEAYSGIRATVSRKDQSTQSQQAQQTQQPQQTQQIPQAQQAAQQDPAL